MHGVRIRWLSHAAPHFTSGLVRFPKGAEPGKRELTRALKASEKAVSHFLAECEETESVKGWHGSPATFLGYLVAHEAHHRGLAMVAMRLCDRKLADDVVYGQWQWGKKRTLR
jgi:uncharacterized damage-inducible protein DinB